MIENIRFKNTSNPDQDFSIEDIIQKIKDWINEDTYSTYEIIVGTDSLYRKKYTVFSSVVIIHRIGHEARFWFTQTREKMPQSIPVRLMKEVYDSVSIIQALLDSDLKQMVAEENWAVHCDVGMKGESRQIINQVVGYVTGQGLKCEYKPDAAIASNVADRFTK
jgi:predicted RNase H-related nuclease YkuK (DUF458 family)